MVDATAAVAAAAERTKDRSSAQFAHHNDDDAILAKSTIDLAHKLGFMVVEGVENTACLASREECDCDMIQGRVDGALIGPTKHTHRYDFRGYFMSASH
ncbi:EAL domain-containing protein [Sphingomonas ginsenosidivorax]|uniref:EAL domain-containing protein n=1 Tax=Sphingomonas ginsenosidivorax TaxID=862135 RepID=A0A5C6UAF7_9SPHN|nr:EAL domain-containing protein [Sphingomonas ginsenosidivorax]